MVVALRILLALLVTAAAAVVAVPLVVLVDLTAGGTGWGLCPNGLEECPSSYFAGPELLFILALLLFGLAAGIAMSKRALRALERRSRNGGK